MILINILILEWINECNQFLNNHQLLCASSEGNRLSIVDMVSTKHLNSILIENCIEIFTVLTYENVEYICSEINKNPVFTMDMVLRYPELQK